MGEDELDLVLWRGSLLWIIYQSLEILTSLVLSMVPRGSYQSKIIKAALE